MRVWDIVGGVGLLMMTVGLGMLSIPLCLFLVGCVLLVMAISVLQPWEDESERSASRRSASKRGDSEREGNQ